MAKHDGLTAKQRVKQTLASRAKKNRQAAAARNRRKAAQVFRERQEIIRRAVMSAIRAEYGTGRKVLAGEVEWFAEEVRRDLYEDSPPLSVCNRTIRRFLERECLVTDDIEADMDAAAQIEAERYDAAWRDYCEEHEIDAFDHEENERFYDRFYRETA
jgi:hypothetical protein